MLHVFHYVPVLKFNSPGYMHLKDFENSSSSFIAQIYNLDIYDLSSLNQLVAWYS